MIEIEITFSYKKAEHAHGCRFHFLVRTRAISQNRFQDSIFKKKVDHLILEC